MTFVRKINLQYWIVAVVVASCLGCAGEKPADPTSAIAIGSATIDGNPITGGMITILSADNRSRRASGVLRPDGTFRLAGSPIGACRVVIDTTSIRVGDPSSYMPVPVKYHAPATTDLAVDLQPGENEGIELRLKSK